MRPYHHDESIHAFFSWKILENGLGDYKYDPVYHGPLLYYSSALMMLLFGDNDFTARLSAVVFGLGVIAFAWPLRRYLGRWGALAFMLLVTFSPSWTYFTRFIRHDIYLALCNLGAVYFAFRYGETRARQAPLHQRRRSSRCAFANKEDMYLLAPLFLVALVVMMLWGVLRGEQTLKRGDSTRPTSFLRRSLVADPHLAGHLRRHLGAALHLVRLPPGEVVRGAARRSPTGSASSRSSASAGPGTTTFPSWCCTSR